MIFAAVSSLSQRKKNDLLVIPFWQGKKSAEVASKEPGKLAAFFDEPVKLHDFKGNEGEIHVVYMSGQPEKRMALLGLGEEKKCTVETLRRAYASVVKLCQKYRLKDINLLLPKILSEQEAVRGICEGILLLNYTFDKLRSHSLKEQAPVLITHIHFVDVSKEALKAAKKALQICKGVYFTRDLVNGNADDVTPQHLGDAAKGLAKEFSSIKTTVFDKKRIEQEKMGLLLAVSRGASVDPAFIIAEYSGKPSAKEHTILVGKGVTYDTGGLNIKTTGMDGMKYDMAGAATVLGILYAVASLGLKINLTAVIPSTENSISSTSYKPGDVYRAYNGKTVEIGNTDAEGRLILADALAYAVKNLKPTRIIDFATLTGAIEIALGHEATGLMSNNAALQESLIEAGNDTFERAHPLPMFPEYRELLKSEFADMRNIGGKPGSSITAAKFLEEFVDHVPWAHFDIAGIAWFDKPKRYFPHHASGMCVRLMLSFLEKLA
jgi:leucyl aminopeptidase